MNITNHYTHPTKQVAICDDEVAIADLVGELLKSEGYEVLVCYTADQLLSLLETAKPDLIVLDVMMPGKDGFSCCREIRMKNQIPIIFLTAKDTEIDKVVGFELGADDYITKPFRPREFIARVKARLRRTELPEIYAIPDRSKAMEVKGIRLDESSHEVTLHTEALTLTPKEFAILTCLMKKKGTPVPSKLLFEEAWGEVADAQSNNTVMVHIRHLRKKFSDIDSSQEFIETVWGIGYKLG